MAAWRRQQFACFLVGLVLQAQLPVQVAAIGGVGSSSSSALRRTEESDNEQEVDCGMDAQSKALLLLTSSGLGSWKGNGIEPSAELVGAFRDLVLQLPDSAWSGGDGAERKKLGAKQPGEHDDLYKGLDVVLLEDGCFLKDSFWNPENNNFNHGSGLGLNHESAKCTTPADKIKPFIGHGLDTGWCYNFAADRPGFMAGLGFDPGRIHHVTLLDSLADDDTKTDIFKLQTEEGFHSAAVGSVIAKGDQAKALEEKLDKADVIVMNGGNPDLSNFVYTKFAAGIMETVKRRVKEGTLVFMGQSAGAIVGGSDIGLTYEPNAALLRDLLHGDTSGLGLAGRCAIRPHDKGRQWDIASAIYGKLRDVNVVRVASGAGFKCRGTTCSVVGTQVEDSIFTEPGEQKILAAPVLQRLVDAFTARSGPLPRSAAWRLQAPILPLVAIMSHCLLLR